jgi:uncharacterized protein (UPF0261 family)
MATIVVFGTLDTKGTVHHFLAQTLRSKGYSVLLVDVSLRGKTSVPVDLSRAEVLRRAVLGEGALEVDARGATSAMGKALGKVLLGLLAQKRLDAVVSAGGRIGMLLAAEALQMLPFGIPSVLVTNVPNALAGLIESGKDVTVFPCLIEPAGLNRIVRPLLRRAAQALCGMLEFGMVAKWLADRPLIVAGRFGHSQFGFERARRILERAGYDVVLFTRKGAGGRVMESVIASGLAAGVLDLSMVEVAEQVVGGTPATRTARLEAAGRRGIAAVIAPGGVDAVPAGDGPLPLEFDGRTTVDHQGALLVRTTGSEVRAIAMNLAMRLNRYLGPVTVCVPTRGTSGLSGAGRPFHDPEADLVLVDTLEKLLRKGVRVVRVKTNAEDTPFLERCVAALLENIRRQELDVEMLRGVRFLRNASEVVLRELARLLEAFSFAEGAVVEPPQGEVDGLYCVSQGTVEVIAEDRVRRRVLTGEIYGERDLVFGRGRFVRLRALENSEVLFLSCSAFQVFCETHPELEEAVAEMLRRGEWSE